MTSPFAAALLGLLVATAATAQPTKPTIVLVHGAFADSSSWNGVVEILEKDGFAVVAVANPLRGVASDAQYVAGSDMHRGDRDRHREIALIRADSLPTGAIS